MKIDTMQEEKKIKLFLDTSVPIAFYDTSKPLRQLITQKWFENRASSYHLYISATALKEISNLENVIKKQNIRDLIFDHNVKILELSEEAVKLADEYIRKGAIPKSEPEIRRWPFRHYHKPGYDNGSVVGIDKRLRSRYKIHSL